MARSLIDFITEEDYPRYMELLNMANEAKANAPKKVRGPRAPMTAEEKKVAYEKKIRDLQAKIDALMGIDEEI